VLWVERVLFKGENGPGLTLIEEEIDRVPSLAVRVLFPAVLSLAVNRPFPRVRILLAGRLAFRSLLVNEISPVYPLAMFSFASNAVTLKLASPPAVTSVGRLLMMRCVAPDASTLRDCLAVRVPSVAVKEMEPAVFSVNGNRRVPLMRGAELGRIAIGSSDEKLIELE
jgi:hypothetical protein